ncbi:PilZ domain-containing protein [Erythrobacter litoralis]|uniref:PilZ domain-containing protein n=1 Tax=Erythrobacter litoralis TaxID=39960 RepID=UPI0024360C47|nr:PilZ domain-containing protein [Erythrobacter litoralis]MDG6079353.1 PilZ domain-containing protein [Erythrobacter litoralis]
MEYGGFRHETVDPVTDQRSAPRFLSLIRAAKLVCGQGEFLCVIRDVSANGIGLRTFHNLPTDPQLALELQNGEQFELEEVRREGFDASYQFRKPIEVDRLIHETWNYPKRQLRLNITVPLVITTLTQRAKAVTLNLSQQGARIECDQIFSIDQTVRIEGAGIADVRAKVRWRRDENYGLVFENTYSLREFALTAAALQCPAMLSK